jgi:peptidoglycan hydrolase-like amidase/peptidoglycan hydrolase CwlO-like protein
VYQTFSSNARGKMGEMRKIILVCMVLAGYFFAASYVFAQECTPENINKVSTTTDQDFLRALLTKCGESIQSMENAVRPSRAELDRMNKAIAAFEARIKTIEADVAKKTLEIAQGEKELEASLVLASERIRQFYMRSYTLNPMYLLFSSTTIGSALRTLGYQQAAVNEDKKIITQIALTVKDLEDKKKALEDEKVTLAALKADTDRRAVSVRALVAQAEAYESKVQGYIAVISARQQEFLAQKLAGLGIPLYAISGGGCSSDLTNGKDPGFSGGFGFFTYGVPNRVGLNQYGSWGRAKAGQDYETILRAYYNFDSISDANAQIRVDGYSTYSLDDYVKRIYEVPDSWTDNDMAALKAQAIAVRSYALAYTNNGQGSICTTQQCQVFKPDPKGGNWETAVNATAGKVMLQGGNPIKAFFSSTHGGYAFNTGDLTGWSTTSYTKRMVDTSSGSVSSFSDLRSNAYDKDSPWFYCDWGGRSSYGGTAWLKPDELADIVNVILLASADSSAQKHLVQTDKPNPDGVDTWDSGTVRSKLGSEAYNSISDVSVNADFGTGRVTSVTVSGDGKSNSFDGNNFKTYFNLRAPSNIQIVGPLYNVEKR